MTETSYVGIPRLITPSRTEAWAGSLQAGDRFTGEQMRKMAALGIDPATVDTLKVRRNATVRELWWPSSGPTPFFVFECPVLNRRADGRVMVIAPAGINKLVYADGSITGRKWKGRK